MKNTVKTKCKTILIAYKSLMVTALSLLLGWLFYAILNVSVLDNLL
jgi:hypothetical protein